VHGNAVRDIQTAHHGHDFIGTSVLVPVDNAKDIAIHGADKDGPGLLAQCHLPAPGTSAKTEMLKPAGNFIFAIFFSAPAKSACVVENNDDNNRKINTLVKIDRLIASLPVKAKGHADFHQ